MSFVVDVFQWLTDSANWTGTFGIPNRFWEHIRYSVAGLAGGIVLAVPVGIWLGHLRRFGTLAINVANIGRALPSFALLALSQQMFGLDELPFAGPTTAFVALVALAVPPILVNTYTGMAEVPDSVRDAARGMGYTGWQRALKVELPGAVALILAGVRISAVQVVATATLAAVVGSGGLGRYIIDGIAVNDQVELAAGAVLVAILAIFTELFFSGLTRLLVPAGLRRRTETAPTI